MGGRPRDHDIRSQVKRPLYAKIGSGYRFSVCLQTGGLHSAQMALQANWMRGGKNFVGIPSFTFWNAGACPHTCSSAIPVTGRLEPEGHCGELDRLWTHRTLSRCKGAFSLPTNGRGAACAQKHLKPRHARFPYICDLGAPAYFWVREIALKLQVCSAGPLGGRAPLRIL